MTQRLLVDAFSEDGPFPGQARPLRLAIIGGGGIARVHAWAAKLSERWTVAAVVPSSDPAQAKERGRAGAGQESQIYGDYREMLREAAGGDVAVDAVAVTVPNHQHHEIASACLDAGLNVLCEKPLTNDVDEARDLVERTRQSKRIVCVGYPYAGFPMVRQARHLITSGALGPVRQVHVEFVQDFLLTQAPASGSSWRQDPAQAGAGSSADIGTHAFHLAEFVTGVTVEKLRADFHVSGPPARVIEDTFYAFLRARDGISGTLWGTQVAAGITNGPRFRIVGERGSLEWSNGSPQELQCHWLDQPTQTFTRGRGRGLAPSAERFTRRGRGNTEGWVEAWANLYTEFALAIAADADGAVVPAGVLEYPTVQDGARGSTSSRRW